MSYQEILGPDGTIARQLANFEARPQQLAMAEAVASAIDQKKHLMVEAGTGVGKSFAYLVPALQAALEGPKRTVIVSTHTISLQEQLIEKDIPFLRKVMPKPFLALLVKGRGNYLSKRRLRVAQQRAPSLLHEDAGVWQLQNIGSWSTETRDGTRSDLEFKPITAVWELVQSDSNNCLGRKCKDFDECFYFRARKKIQDAQLLVVNHALFFTDLALRAIKKGFLPQYSVVIFDEAHTLEDVAADHMGLDISRGQADFLLNKLLHERKGAQHGLLSIHGDDDSFDQVYRTRQEVERFFRSIQDWRLEQLLRQGKNKAAADSLRVREPKIVGNSLSEAWVGLAGCIDRLVEGMRNPEEQIELQAMSGRCADFADRLDNWIEQKLPDQAYWIESSGADGAKVNLASAPMEVGPILREQLFDKVPSVILTSATLSTGGAGGFGYIKERLGFPEHPTLHLGSPFNFREQAELHLFRRMPDPSTREYENAVREKIQEYVSRTGGRAFVLFTSNGMMQRLAQELQGWFHGEGMTLLCQSDGLPPTRMLEQFRKERAGVLFGVDSFWQGVDVQGEALSNVIITKLPFTPPDRPLVEARGEVIRTRGGNAFFDQQLPQAVIKLKQGVGRLIRTQTDRGLIVILDPRMLVKPYGRTFLDALPPCRRFIDGVEVPG